MTKAKTFPVTRRGLISLCIAFVLYCDAAVILNYSIGSSIRLPLPYRIVFYNTMFKVFERAVDVNSSFVARVATKSPTETNARWDWSERDVHELFPMPRGESLVRLYLIPGCHTAAEMLVSIYQRRDPDTAIGGVRLFKANWPASPNGFFARYDERQVEPMCAYWAP